MPVFILLALTLSGIPMLSAQATAVYPPIQLNYQDVAAYLHLSSTQLQALKAIQTNRQDALREVAQAVNQKQQQLNALLSANNPDPQEIGRLSVELYNLRKQLTGPVEPYHSQAVAILTADQRNELATLSDALQLESAASQAVMLSLIPPLQLGKGGQIPLEASRRELR